MQNMHMIRYSHGIYTLDKQSAHQENAAIIKTLIANDQPRHSQPAAYFQAFFIRLAAQVQKAINLVIATPLNDKPMYNGAFSALHVL